MSSISVLISGRLYEVDYQPFDDPPRIRDKLLLLHNIKEEVDPNACDLMFEGQILPETVPLSSLGVANRAVIKARTKDNPLTSPSSSVDQSSPNYTVATRSRTGSVPVVSKRPTMPTTPRSGQQENFFTNLVPDSTGLAPSKVPEFLTRQLVTAVVAEGSNNNSNSNQYSSTNSSGLSGSFLANSGGSSGSSSQGSTTPASTTSTVISDPFSHLESSLASPNATQRSITDAHRTPVSRVTSSPSHFMQMQAKRHSMPQNNALNTNGLSQSAASPGMNYAHPHIDTSSNYYASNGTHAGPNSAGPASPGLTRSLSLQQPHSAKHHGPASPEFGTFEEKMRRKKAHTESDEDVKPHSAGSQGPSTSNGSPSHANGGPVVSNPFAALELRVEQEHRNSIVGAATTTNAQLMPHQHAFFPANNGPMSAVTTSSRQSFSTQLNHMITASPLSPPLHLSAEPRRYSISSPPIATAQQPAFVSPNVFAAFEQQSAAAAAATSLSAEPIMVSHIPSALNVGASVVDVPIVTTPVNVNAVYQPVQSTTAPPSHRTSVSQNPFALLEAVAATPHAAVTVAGTFLPPAHPPSLPHSASVSHRGSLSTAAGINAPPPPLLPPSLDPTLSVVSSSSATSSTSSASSLPMTLSTDSSWHHLPAHLKFLLEAVEQESSDLLHDQSDQRELKNYQLDELTKQIINIQKEREKTEKIHLEKMEELQGKINQAEEELKNETHKTEQYLLSLDTLRFERETKLQSYESKMTALQIERLEKMKEMNIWEENITKQMGLLSVGREEQNDAIIDERKKRIAGIVENILQHTGGDKEDENEDENSCLTLLTTQLQQKLEERRMKTK